MRHLHPGAVLNALLSRRSLSSVSVDDFLVRALVAYGSCVVLVLMLISYFCEPDDG